MYRATHQGIFQAIPGKADMVAFTKRAKVPKHVLVRVLDRESVLLNLETEKYFGLDETGTRMWQLATASPNIDAAYQELLEEFDVAPELLQNNLSDLLDKLVEHGLLEMLPVDTSATPAV
jgi:coenzyme PQQ synthesis protein D (PqqD)